MHRAPRTAREMMTPAPYTFRPGVPIVEAAGRLVREHYSGAPVLDAEGKLVGVLSELDLIAALAPVEHGIAPTGVVGDWMNADPLVLQPDATVYALAQLFTEAKVRRAPVVEDGRLVGIVSRHDVLRALVRIGIECARATADEAEFVP